MERIRIGNDINIRWEIFARQGDENVPYDLTDKNLTLILANTYGSKKPIEFTTEGNAVCTTFFGKDQKTLGAYSMTLIENEGKEGMHTIDQCNVFELVSKTCHESDYEQGGGNRSRIVKVRNDGQVLFGRY